MDESPQAKFEQLCEFVEARAKAKGVPGVSVGVLHGDASYTAGFGVTNAEHSLPVTDETLFQIGSITKTFTSLAMMRLVERGMLDLQATVRSYLPAFRVADDGASAQATVWHLLTHVAGWAGDLFEDTGSGPDALPAYVARMADLEQLAPLGEVFSYNNASFNLAGHLIEEITGQRYERAMGELVFEPLGLKRCFFEAGDVITHRFAVGHHAEGGEAHVLRPWPLPRSARPAGGIVCDVHELLRYARFQLGDGAVPGKEEPVQVLRPEHLRQMHTPQASRWRDKEQIGLAWFVDDIQGTRQLSHGGGTLGQTSLLALYPQHELAFAILTNADAGGAIASDVRKWVLEHYLGIQEAPAKPLEASEEELAAFVGFYSRPFADVELGLLNGRLVAQMIYKQGFPSQDMPPPPPPPPSALALCEKDRLLIVGGPGQGGKVEVIRRPDGSIGWLRSGRIHKRVKE